jgi:ribosomal protein S18 acetylase RimI-like enzyme
MALSERIDIRLLGAGDERVLERVDSDVFDDPIDPGRAREFLSDPRHHVAVAIDGGLVVGFASGVHYVHPDKPVPELWVNELGVASTHRQRGIGKAVLGCLLEAARAVGCTEAWVLTERDNVPAMRLYGSIDGAQVPSDHVMISFALDRLA